MKFDEKKFLVRIFSSTFPKVFFTSSTLAKKKFDLSQILFLRIIFSLHFLRFRKVRLPKPIKAIFPKNTIFERVIPGLFLFSSFLYS